MLKKLLLLLPVFFCLFNVNAQHWDKINLGVEIGFPAYKQSNNLGLIFNVEPKLKVSDNGTMGMRIGIAINSQTIEKTSSTYIIDNRFDHGFLSVIPSFDYHWSENDFRPYLGLGVGAYSLGNYIDVSRIGNGYSSEDVFDVKIGHQIGVLLRTGFESGKLRLGLEYNFVPEADIDLSNGQNIGTIDSSYLGITAGLIIGYRQER